jgi:hypothetical protein
MSEKPILFSTEMVRAILDNRKTQTRRVVMPQPHEGSTILGPDYYEPIIVGKDGEEKQGKKVFGVYDSEGEWGVKVSYEVGDILWVRETLLAEKYACNDWNGLNYAADNDSVDAIIPTDWYPPANSIRTHREEGDNIPFCGFNWYTAKIPSIFMPRWAARLFLRVENVRAERVQEISAEDVEAEGIDVASKLPIVLASVAKKQRMVLANLIARRLYGNLWNSLNAKRGYSWESNPAVFVYTFSRVER